MELTKAIILGIIQGVTEFLPISSTGHLIVTEHLFNLNPETFGLTFDLALHIGTLFALLAFFRKDIQTIILDREKSSISIQAILVGTIPAAVIGLLLESIVEESLRDYRIVAVNLILFSALLYWADRLSKKKKEGQSTITLLQAFIIGCFQSIAIIPGVSRSGATIAGAMIVGKDRSDASRFAFILSIPIILLAAGKQGLDIVISGRVFSSSEILFFLVGTISSTITALIVLKWFMAYFRRAGFFPFIIYRILLAIAILLFIK